MMCSVWEKERKEERVENCLCWKWIVSNCGWDEGEFRMKLKLVNPSAALPLLLLLVVYNIWLHQGKDSLVASIKYISIQFLKPVLRINKPADTKKMPVARCMSLPLYDHSSWQKHRRLHMERKRLIHSFKKIHTHSRNEMPWQIRVAAHCIIISSCPLEHILSVQFVGSTWLKLMQSNTTALH